MHRILYAKLTLCRSKAPQISHLVYFPLPTAITLNFIGNKNADSKIREKEIKRMLSGRAIWSFTRIISQTSKVNEFKLPNDVNEPHESHP